MHLVATHRHLSAVAVSVAGALVLSACSNATSDDTRRKSPKSASSTSSSSPTSQQTSKPASGSATPKATGAAVHVSLLQGDGVVYGVGMPLVAYFDRKVSDPAAFEKAVTVTVNGKSAGGAWYWERSGRAGAALEAHYRGQQYWPANAQISMKMPVKGLSAGLGVVYDNNLTLDISTGASHTTVVDCAAEKMVVSSGGKRVRSFPTSCGKAKTPTYTGTKLVMQKGEEKPGSSQLRPEGAVRMRSTNPADPYDLIVPWSVRLTTSGEYAHAASWNGGNIGRRSTSNGCTNLNEKDAKWFYAFSRLGDVLTYSNTGGATAPSWDGFGDWNVPWIEWQSGGVL